MRIVLVVISIVLLGAGTNSYASDDGEVNKVSIEAVGKGLNGAVPVQIKGGAIPVRVVSNPSQTCKYTYRTSRIQGPKNLNRKFDQLLNFQGADGWRYAGSTRDSSNNEHFLFFEKKQCN